MGAGPVAEDLTRVLKPSGVFNITHPIIPASYPPPSLPQNQKSKAPIEPHAPPLSAGICSCLVPTCLLYKDNPRRMGTENHRFINASRLFKGRR